MVSEFFALPRSLATVFIALSLLAVSQPSAAITLVRCKIDKKTVWSDTECPNDGKNRNRSAFMSDKPSKPIHMKYARKRTVGNTAAKKSASSRTAR